MKAAIFYADGHEEVEALTVVDILRRSGITTDMISISDDLTVTGSHNVALIADKKFTETDFNDYDAFILPGGMPGTENLFGYEPLTSLLRENAEKKLICAICAAPTVLGRLGLLKNHAACGYPGTEGKLDCPDIKYDEVVCDGKVITSRGLGTAIPFALAIVSTLLSKETADELAEKIVYRQ